jgi:hypothetical protein
MIKIKNNCVSAYQISCETEENYHQTFNLFCGAYGEGG